MKSMLAAALLSLLLFAVLPARADEETIDLSALEARLLKLDPSPVHTLLTMPPKASPDCIEVTSVTLSDTGAVPKLRHVVSLRNKCAADIMVTGLLTGDSKDKLEPHPQEVRLVRAVGGTYDRIFSAEGAECTISKLFSDWGPKRFCRAMALDKDSDLQFTVTQGGYYKLSGYAWPVRDSDFPPSDVLVAGRRTQGTLDDAVSFPSHPPSPDDFHPPGRGCISQGSDCFFITDDGPYPREGRAERERTLGDLLYILGDKDTAKDWWTRVLDRKDVTNNNAATRAELRQNLLAADPEHAVAWLENFKKSGAYFDGLDCLLGAHYAAGRGVARDADKAYKYWGVSDFYTAPALQARAEAGHARSQYEYGMIMVQNKCAASTPEIWDEAMGWFEKAAASGYPLAQYRVGLHAVALGNTERGQQLLQKAAAQELPEAQTVLGLQQVGRDDKAAQDWLRKAAAHGDAEAEKWLALLNLGIWGDRKSDEEAWFWLQTMGKGGSSLYDLIGGIDQLEKKLGPDKIVELRARVGEWEPKSISARAANYLPVTTSATYVTLPVRAAAEAAYWTHLPYGFMAEDVPDQELLQRKVAQDAGPPSAPAPQSFTLYRINEFSDNGVAHVVGFSSTARLEKELVYASFDGSVCNLLGNTPPTGQEILVTGTGIAEFVEHNGTSRHGLAIYEMRGPVACTLRPVARVSASQQDEYMSPPGSLLAGHEHDMSVTLLRHLEYTEGGGMAKLVSRNGGMNGMNTHVISFHDTGSVAFQSCRALLANQLPHGKTLILSGKGTQKNYKNDDVENLHAYSFKTIERCELGGNTQDEMQDISYGLFYLPLRRGVDLFPTIVREKPAGVSPQQDWQNYLEQGVELTSRASFEWGPKEARLVGDGEAFINDSRNRLSSPGRIEMVFTDTKDMVLNRCKPLLQAAIPAGQKLTVFGYGSASDRETKPPADAPDRANTVYRVVTQRVSRVLECKLEPVISAARQEYNNSPPGGLWVSSMKIGGATFWLRYIGTGKNEPAMVRKAEIALKNEDGGWSTPEGQISCAQAWLDLTAAAKKSNGRPMRLGRLELTVRGDAKAGAEAVKTYATGESAEHMYMLGHLYFHGVGVAKDLRSAWYWFDRAQHGGAPGGPSPWVMNYASQQAEAVDAALQLESVPVPNTVTGGTRKKVEFKMPGEAGAPALVNDTYNPDMGGPEAMPMQPPAEEGLTLYSPPYPE